MEQLHPYWRMEYIAALRFPETERPFTDLPALGDDARALIVHRSRHSYLLMNRYPYNPGHLLAIPFREVSDIDQLAPDELADLTGSLLYAKRLLTATLHPDGFNIGYNLGSAAGGSIAHLHAHIVPRWQGDSNFMPVIAQTRTLPQALSSLWQKLRDVAATLDVGDNT